MNQYKFVLVQGGWVPDSMASSWLSKANIHTEITSYSKTSKFCIHVLYIWESVLLNFQAFLHSFTLEMDKMVLGGQVPDYVQ